MSDTFADSVEGTPGLTEEMREALGEGEQRPCRHCGIRWADWPRSLCPQCLGGHKIPPDPGLMKAHKHNQTTETYPLSAVPDLEVEPTKPKRKPGPKGDPAKARPRPVGRDDGYYRCLAGPHCQAWFVPYMNGSVVVRTMCQSCLRAKQKATEAATRERKKQSLWKDTPQGEKATKRVESVYGNEVYPLTTAPETYDEYVGLQDLAKAATHVENVVLTVDFTGREDLLATLKQRAFAMCRTPEEQILWTVIVNLQGDHEEC